ncbi:hypothetical protein NBRC116583_17840 [Arenicella sp. 4NH20-0111]|uniref:hypothetical protein n=1 Tax=Arenicella sp. 4NH20-0111 TaxID=3127648 RepID=UPI0031036D7D
MPLNNLEKDKPLPIKQAFRHLIFFQIKLFADAIRDLLFSPISLLAFACDAILKPSVKDSFSYKLTLAGRKSDRMINLFGEYTASGEFTIDETVNELESALLTELNKRRAQGKEE